MVLIEFMEVVSLQKGDGALAERISSPSRVAFKTTELVEFNPAVAALFRDDGAVVLLEEDEVDG